jgi:hypothetical protein
VRWRASTSVCSTGGRRGSRAARRALRTTSTPKGRKAVKVPMQPRRRPSRSRVTKVASRFARAGVWAAVSGVEAMSAAAAGGLGANEVATALRASAVSTGPRPDSGCGSILRWCHVAGRRVRPSARTRPLAALRSRCRVRPTRLRDAPRGGESVRERDLWIRCRSPLAARDRRAATLSGDTFAADRRSCRTWAGYSRRTLLSPLVVGGGLWTALRRSRRQPVLIACPRADGLCWPPVPRRLQLALIACAASPWPLHLCLRRGLHRPGDPMVGVWRGSACR